MSGWLGGRTAPLVLYPLLALLSFPTLGAILDGTSGWTYVLDVLDDGGGVTRLAIAVRDWSANGPTLWDPYLTAGNSLLGQFPLAPYAPDTALAFIVGPFAAFAISAWLISTLAGIGMHLFLRDSLGLSIWAAVGGGLIAVFGFWHPIYGVSVAVLPLVLWIGDRAAQEGPGRTRFVLGGIVVGALALYAGQAQVVLFVILIQVCWIAWTRRGDARGPLVTWAVTWIIAVALYAPVLVTQLVMLPISERTVWDLAYLFGGTIPEAIRTVLDHYGSLLFGIPTARGFGPSDARYGTIFLGGICLSLAVLGVASRPRGRGARFVVLMLVAIPLLDLAAILASPLQEHLGLLRSFQFVRIRHFFPFALAAAAGLGIESIVSMRPGAIRRERAGSVAFVAAGAALALIAFQVVVAGRQVLLRSGSFDGSDPRDPGWILAAVGLAAGLVGGIALLVMVGLARRTPPGSSHHRTLLPVLLGFGLLIVAERALMANGTPLLGPNIGTFDRSLGLTAGQQYLLSQPEISRERVLTFGDNANRMAFVGIRQVDGYQAIYPVTYHGFFGQMTAPGLAADPDRYEYFHSWGARAYAFAPGVDPELVALAGARWLYVRDGPIPTVPGLIERFKDADVTVYENPAAFPRAFLTSGLEEAADDSAVLDRLATASLDELRNRAFTTPAGREALGIESRPSDGPGGAASIVVDQPDRIEVDVTPERPAVLVLTDAAAPGWVAEVDGRPAAIATVDGAFRGVAVRPTDRRVVFRYVPTFTGLGFVLAGVGLAVAAGWWWWLRRGRPTAAGSPGSIGAVRSADD